MVSGREETAPPTAAQVTEIPPEHYIPEEMLLHPPNSLTAMAVGWNLNGGKRQWTKRQLRGRERFTGKWRHWTLDGSRDLAEMDDVAEWFTFGETVNDPTSSRRPDWKNIRKDPVWWEVELGGPQGQPPFPFTPYPHPYRLRAREYDQFDWGVYPEINAEAKLLGSKMNLPDQMALEEQLRPSKPKIKRSTLVPSNFVDVYDGHLDVQSQDALSGMLYGDTLGEAYSQSVQAFIAGAQKTAEQSEEVVKDDFKAEAVDESKPRLDAVPKDGGRISLSDWVQENWHGGVMNSSVRKTMSNTLQEITGLREALDNGAKLTERQEAIYKVAKTHYARRALRYITRPTDPLDIAPLLVEQGDFLWPGVGGKAGVRDGLLWTGNEIVRLAEAIEEERKKGWVEDAVKIENGRKRSISLIDSDQAQENGAKKPRLDQPSLHTPPPTSPNSKAADRAPSGNEGVSDGVKVENGATNGSNNQVLEAQANGDSTGRQDELRRLRLELVALSKFYPLAALKKMDKTVADRLLPPNVRALMSKR